MRNIKMRTSTRLCLRISALAVGIVLASPGFFRLLNTGIQ